MKGFWKEILTSDNSTSSKRLVTLISALIFIIAQFIILFIAFYVIFYTTRGKVDKDLLDLLKNVLEYDFFIILSGLGFITAENLGTILVAKFKYGWRRGRGFGDDIYDHGDYPFYGNQPAENDPNKPIDA